MGVKNTLRKIPRRHFLAGSAGVLLHGSLPALVMADERPVFQPVNNAMRMYTGLGGNVLFFNDGNGGVLVDSGNAESVDSLLFELAEQGGEINVHTLFNTHWHTDQVGGNTALGDRGCTIVAHQKTKEYLSTPHYLIEEDRYQEAMPAAAWPGTTFYTGDRMAAGNETIEYGYLQSAHTNGDIYVRFVNANVIAVGDVVSPLVDPGFDWFSGGWIGGRVDALNLLLDISDADTKFIPSYGAVIGRAHVEAERDLMQFLYDTLVDQIRMGFDYEDSLATGIMDNLPRQLDNPAKFLYDAHKGLWAHHNKLEPNIV